MFAICVFVNIPLVTMLCRRKPFFPVLTSGAFCSPSDAVLASCGIDLDSQLRAGCKTNPIGACDFAFSSILAPVFP